ncbi:MAG TPA: HD domain-containing protein [Thermoleophilaceae bacterium]
MAGSRELNERVAAAPAVRVARAALADGPAEEAWIVGGTVRDALLERPLTDLDLAVRGDPEKVARTIARGAGGPVFALSEAFGAWRAMSSDRGWTCDVTAVHGDGIDADLARRDFSINAIALPLEGGEPHDPQGGIPDLEARALRVLGGPDVEHSAYADDPLRPLRMARLATELSLHPTPETRSLTLAAAPLVANAAAERVFAELRRIVTSDRVVEGLELCDEVGLTAVVLPELHALHGVEQSHFHHLDVHDHTIEVLRCYLAVERDPEGVFGELAQPLDELMSEPFADELTRWQALRFAALLHDCGKPATRGVRPDGRVTFIGHDKVGAEMIRALFRRLKTSERLRELVANVTHHHLVLGFLVHERPLGRDLVYRYLERCQPVEVEVTLLTCADRLATRGKNAEAAIAAHLELARELMAEALAWRSSPPEPAVRGRELAEELGMKPGPELGELLARLREARFTGEAETREQAVALARRLRQNPSR